MTKRIFAAALALCLLLSAGLAFAGQAMNEVVPFGAFEAEDIRGDKPVTEAVFADADVTLVNYWTTWCGPCRAEMPDLAKIAEQSEGRVQVLGVLLDGVTGNDLARDEDAIDAAITLMDASGVEFPVVLPDAWLMAIGGLVSAVPTTFLIDRDGNVLGYTEGSRTADEWITLAAEHYPDAK